MDDIVQYKALYDYSPTEGEFKDGCISLVKGDILEIYPQRQTDLEGTIEKPQGWLEGLNTRTSNHGLFPGQYVEFIPTTPPRPRKPPRPVPRVPKTKVENNDSGYGGSPQSKTLLSYNSKFNMYVFPFLPVVNP